MTGPAVQTTDIVALIAEAVARAMHATHPTVDTLRLRRAAARGAMRGLRDGKPPVIDPE